MLVSLLVHHIPYSAPAKVSMPLPYQHESAMFGCRCPSALRHLITSCWAAEPATRPTAPQVVAALKDILAQQVHLSHQ
jgi:hypothetical protein